MRCVHARCGRWIGSSGLEGQWLLTDPRLFPLSTSSVLLRPCPRLLSLGSDKPCRDRRLYPHLLSHPRTLRHLNQCPLPSLDRLRPLRLNALARIPRPPILLAPPRILIIQDLSETRIVLGCVAHLEGIEAHVRVTVSALVLVLVCGDINHIICSITLIVT
jgi:hypothetical protein